MTIKLNKNIQHKEEAKLKRKEGRRYEGGRGGGTKEGRQRMS